MPLTRFCSVEKSQPGGIDFQLGSELSGYCRQKPSAPVISFHHMDRLSKNWDARTDGLVS
jgi:hypothetical protein